MESSTRIPRKRGHTAPLNDDLPDFLQDSPFLPFGLQYPEAPRVPYKKPSIREVLTSKRVRNTVVGVLLAIVIFLCLRGARRVVNHFRYAGPACLTMRPFYPTQHYLQKENIDWTGFAYAQYATNTEYLCNSVMIFEALHRHGSKASRVLMYPGKFDIDAVNVESQLLLKARDEYNVKLVPIEVQHRNLGYYMWADSYTKLLAFNQTEYKRVIILDSDSTVLNHMDELFFLPATPVALPRAYWLNRPTLGSHIMLIQPSVANFNRVAKAIEDAGIGEYDMEIVNSVFGDSCITIPHRWYALLTGEFRSKTHTSFLAENERWDPVRITKEAKLIHFSDDPFPKPWVQPTQREITFTKPSCVSLESGKHDCRARDIWLDLYLDFKERRESVCNMHHEAIEA